MSNFIEHSYEVLFVPDTNVERVTNSTRKVKDSGIFTIFVGGGWGGVRHNFWEIWRGVRANLLLLRGG